MYDTERFWGVSTPTSVGVDHEAAESLTDALKLRGVAQPPYFWGA